MCNKYDSLRICRYFLYVENLLTSCQYFPPCNLLQFIPFLLPKLNLHPLHKNPSYAPVTDRIINYTIMADVKSHKMIGAIPLFSPKLQPSTFLQHMVTICAVICQYKRHHLLQSLFLYPSLWWQTTGICEQEDLSGKWWKNKRNHCFYISAARGLVVLVLDSASCLN